MAVADSAQQPHVPAWRRLGLKLKYAKDTAEPPSTSVQPTYLNPSLLEDGSTKRANSEPRDDERAFKKRKLISGTDHALQPNPELSSVPHTEDPSARVRPSEAESSRPRVSVESESAGASDKGITTEVSKDQAFSLDSRRPNRPKRRKSVTFTSETKQTDGNTAQPLVEPEEAGKAEKGPEGRSSSPAKSAEQTPAVASKLDEEPSHNQQQSKLTPRKTKKAKSKAPNGAAPKDEKAEYVRYLEQFHKDKASWKFNKNHQTSLLKNLFNVRFVPPALTPAVLDYISGLKGAGPRKRLIADATAILRAFAEKDGSVDEIDAMSTQSARIEAYYKAMAREIQKWEAAGMPRSEQDDDKIADMDAEIEKGKRAEAILQALPLNEDTVLQATTSTPARGSSSGVTERSSRAEGVASPAQTPATSVSQGKARKRKRRVDAPSDSSSSDSDTSSSDSEEETSHIKGPITVAAALRPSPAYTNHAKVPSARTPAYQHDNLNMSYRPQNPSQLMNASVKPTKKFFDDELLDKAFPKSKTHHESAPKRRKTDGAGKTPGRGFAYTHGTRDDESESEDD